MKKLNLTAASVTETQGVFEDLDAIRDLEATTRKTDHYFVDEESSADGCDLSETQSGS